MLFTIKINPKIETIIYRYQQHYISILTTNKLNNKQSYIKYNGTNYKTIFNLIYEFENINYYLLTIDNFNFCSKNNYEIEIFLPAISLFQYLIL